MSRFLRWLHIRLLCIQWGITNATKSEDGGGWVVVADHGTPDEWHAMGGGAEYGMDYASGRFQCKDDAYAFCDMRNAERDGRLPDFLAHDVKRYSVTHESATFKPLPNRY